MISADSFKVIADLDLEPIKVKLMHVASGEGWSLQRANAVEFEYRRFLYLMKSFPQEETAPLVDVDTFWHYHILDTLKYAVDCEQVFGYFLHHFPYIGLRGEDDEAAHERVGERMKELYEATFGESYLRTDSAYIDQPQQVAASGAAVAASGAAVAASGAATRMNIAASGAAVAASGAATRMNVAASGAAVAASGAATRMNVAASGAAVAASGAATRMNVAASGAAVAASGAATRMNVAASGAAVAASGAATRMAVAASGAAVAASGAAVRSAVAASGAAVAASGAATVQPQVASLYSHRPRLSA